MSERELRPEELQARDRLCHEWQTSDLARRVDAVELMVLRRLASHAAALPEIPPAIKRALDQLEVLRDEAKLARTVAPPEQFDLIPPA